MSRHSPALILCVLAVGVVLSSGVFIALRDWEQESIEKRAADLTHEQVEKLQVTILRSMEVLYSIASLHGVKGRLEREQFGMFVRQSLERQPELQALSWNPVVTAARRAELESLAVADGLTSFQLREMDAAGQFVPAKERPAYVPVYFIEPLESNVVALGYDLASDSSRFNSIERARDSGKPVATAPIQLAQGPENQVGFLVLLPVYHGLTPTTLAERREKLAGFAVAVFRANDLVGQFFRELKNKGIEASLYDDSPAGKLLYADTTPPHKAGAVQHLEVAGRKWAMVFKALPTSSFATVSHQQSRLVLMVGLTFTLLTTAYLYGGWRRTAEITAANTALQKEIAVRERAEAAAEAANAAKSDFLASMSHEIRTPLNAILGYTQLMQRDPSLPPEQHDAIEGISSSGKHLLGLINEILDLSKIEAGRMELNPTDFDLAMLGNGLAATFRPLCAQKRVGFRLEVRSTRETRVRGDDGKLRQVLINLVGNAVKFTSAGEVHLRISPEAGGCWLFEVIDTGLGIPEEEQKDIFQPFHQGSGAAHQGGTGLGLAIAQRQTKLLGGELKLQSERGIGSRFFFSLPLEAAMSEVRETPLRVVKLASGQTVRALVVDDNKENREVLGGMLSAVGCEVFVTSGGDEALEQLRAHKPAIVFVDLLMPGLSGLELARRISITAAVGAPKIIAHTASALARHRDEAFAAGCVDFLAKPFSCERLYECLERQLGVVFEREIFGGEPEVTAMGGLERVTLPDALAARLMVAAELHSTTALKSCLQELRAGSPDAMRLAEEIRQLMRSYDMDGIQRLLSRVVIADKMSQPDKV